MDDRRVWVALILVIALAVVLAGYYWVHKPVTPAQAQALALVLADAAVAALLTLAGGGLGRRLVRGQGVVSAGERVALEAALGWGVIGLAMLGLGLARLYYAALIWTLIVLALVLLWRDARAWLADLGAALRAMWSASRWACLFIGLMLVLGLLRALAPPVMWDALVYHLTLPKLYAQTHGVQIETDLLFSGMPQITEMLYTAATLMRSPIAAQVLGWVFGLLLAVGLAAHTSELLGERVGVLAPAILFSALTIALSLSWAYTELLLMLFVLALLIALRQWKHTGSMRWLVWGGVVAGLALSVKYTGALVPLAGAVTIAFCSIKRDWKSRVRHVAVFGVVAFCVFTPWLIKNGAFTGSPTYPILFPAGQMDRFRQWFYSRPDLAERNPFWAALIFFRAAFLGAQSANEYDATLGPLLVILLLALVIGWRGLDALVRRELKPLGVFALVAYAGWVALMFVSHLTVQARLFFALFPVLAILCAGGLAAVASLDSSVLRASMIVNAIVALVLVLTVLENITLFAARSPLAYLAGAQNEAQYRAMHLGAYVAAMDRVNALPPGSRVEFLWETRSLDCVEVDRCAPDPAIFNWWHLRRTVGSADAIIAHWKAQGVTHVLIYESGVSFIRLDKDVAYLDSDWTELDALKRRMRLVHDIQGVYSLYDLP